MKLATLKNGSRDGLLVIVDRALARCVPAAQAATLQQLLDRWDELAPAVQARSDALNAGKLPDARPFDPAQAMAPLPRAYQWCDGSAYLSHAELVRKARKAEMPEFLYQDPMMYQGASDTFLGPLDAIEVEDEAWGIDLEAEVAIVTSDVPMGVSAQDARAHIRLLMIVNDVSLRNLIPHELSKGFGFFHSKPSTAFAPVAVTPDELGEAWDGAKISLPLVSVVNGQELGHPHAGVDLNFDFPTLIAHAAKSRRLAAGTVIGSGTVSNRDPAAGSSCLAEKRMLEVIAEGKPSTPFLRFGDRVEIDMRDARGQSVFGRIDQKVVRYVPTGR
ncbi:fumarylacetoacetate hydrolase family protein [Ramlibacter sp.]|uniref:fumarylacetoacetate hydrolase family protein n=1 Tax=Ramlibacter sp. TaxID=1917967 RepID=UPI00263235DC|nr:fumarylacetoacetate hydrolase family protein [Ramlibacter sp.]MDB5953827.1 hydrolase family protein [Ramlibacter sp.]